MQDHHRVFRLQSGWLDHVARAQDIASHLGRVDAVMAAEESSDQLRKDAPHKFLLRELVVDLELFDDFAEISAAAILHVQM